MRLIIRHLTDEEFVTLGVNSVLHHNLVQCVWLLYRELDTLHHFCYYELLVQATIEYPLPKTK